MESRAAHAATKITVGRCRWWGLHKFGVPIKMISLSHQQVGFSNVAPRHVANNPSGEEEEEESLHVIFKTRKAIPE